MKRNAIILVLVVSVILVLGLGGTLVYLISQRSVNTQGSALERIQKRAPVVLDKFAGKEQEAIEIVKNFAVMNPEYIDAFMEHRKNPKVVLPEADTVTIESLVEKNFLEDRFNMHFLKKGEWRALHLDTDMESGAEQTPDPQYEVYLNYHDESVTVGPVWIVDLETKNVIARNDMARIFTRTIYDCDKVAENLERPESVIHAISSHTFSAGIDLGGVFLLHFLKLTSLPGHSEDEIIGWTVMQEFKDDYSAYFQWKEKGENRVAKFAFNWETKRLEPKGLLALDLMAAGENMAPISPVDIYPSAYTNNLNIPRTERWPKEHACRLREYREICTGLVEVFENQEFVSALEWLLTNGEANASHRIDVCKNEKKCRWIFHEAEKDLNPQGRPELVYIAYKYAIGEKENTIQFLVDSEKETIEPLDKISRWAYWSVTPRK